MVQDESGSFEATRDVKAAVVTGHHPFDVPGFHALFRGMNEVDAYIQHLEDFSSDAGKVRSAYDAVVFYNMHRRLPAEDGPWYEKDTKASLERLGETAQGIVVLHHAILAFPDWAVWSELVGIADRSFAYHIGEQLRVEVANADHQITAGLQSWTMVDETYTMADAGEGSEILLTTDHPQSMKTLAWTRPFRKARVFCYQSGHDNRTWAEPSFREVLRRGILWAAGRL